MNDILTCCNVCDPPEPLLSDGKRGWCPKCKKTWEDIKADIERSRKYRENHGDGF